jgi:B12-binding domain/radical SAM domain protein
MFPAGLMSMAEYLERNGYKVKIINLGEKMLSEGGLDVEEYIKSLEAKVFGIDLHWCVHAQGALETAKLCKKMHPESLVILGGLTATGFHEELISTYPFVDAVLRGESEEALLKLLNNLDKGGELTEVPNLTFREKDGRIKINPIAKPPESLDEFNYTRFDLVEPFSRIVKIDHAVWNIPVCRGCIFNCATCGGSAYSYRKLMGREGPAFRSPEKIVEDFHDIDEYGMNSVFLFQDVRLGGEHYWRELFKLLAKERWTNLEHMTLELFYPPEGYFLDVIAKAKPVEQIGMGISPDSGERVRQRQGRLYPDEAILQTAHAFKGHGFSLGVFFMIGLADETYQTIEEMWLLWDRLLRMNEPGDVSVGVSFCPMIILDPFSPAFDEPRKYGYKIRFKTLREHVEAASMPSWKYWFNYETNNLGIDDLVDLTLMSGVRMAEIYGKYGLYTNEMVASEWFRSSLEKAVIKELDKIVEVREPAERMKALNELNQTVNDPFLAKLLILSTEEAWSFKNIFKRIKAESFKR